MLRCAGGIGLALSLAGCVEQVLLHDVHDAGATQDSGLGMDAPWNLACIESQPIAYHPQPAQVLILLDRSLEMQKSFGGSTREDAAQQALNKAAADYAAWIDFGLLSFPTDPSNTQCPQGSCCADTIGIDPGTYSVTEKSDFVSCSGSHGLGCSVASADSPSYAALKMARDYYWAKYPPTADQIYVLLVTASNPTCAAESSDVCSLARSYAADLGEAYIRVIILSLGYQPDRNSCLAQISQKGYVDPFEDIRNPPLYAVSNNDDLSAGLTEILTAIKRNACTLSSLPRFPPNLATLTIAIGTETIPQVDDSSQDGWLYASPTNHTQITFNGSACDQWLDSPEFPDSKISYQCSTCGGVNSCDSLRR